MLNNGGRPQSARLFSSSEKDDYELNGLTAVVPIRGLIWDSELPEWCNACNSEKLSKVLHHLEQSDAKQVILQINSPGGLSTACEEIASAVTRLAKTKSVHAFIRGDGCSAAYRIACCAKSITAANGSLVGSIGVYILAYDYSKMLQKEGIRAVLIKSGPQKGAGAFGVEITKEQEDRLQGIVDSITAEFFKAVSESRNLSMDDVATWGDGGYWTAEDAIKMKLVDRICDWSTYITEFSETQTAGRVSFLSNQEGGNSMSENTEKPVSATVQELKKAFPKASSGFLVEQLEKGATLDEAKTSYISFLEKKIESATSADDEEDDSSKKKSKSEDDEDDESTKKKSKKSKSEDDDEDGKCTESSKTAGSLGNQPHGSESKGAVCRTATEQWEAAVEEKMSKGLSKAQAVKAVVAENPELQKAYLAEFNEKKK